MKAVDSDTIEVRVRVWLGQEVITRVRLRGIDVPEIAGACGSERSQAVAASERLACVAGRGAANADRSQARQVFRAGGRACADRGW